MVRIDDRYDTDIEDLWTALTDPARLARWYSQVEGDLRLGGQFRTYLEASETDESYQRGQGVPPFDASIEVTLTAFGDQTDLSVQVRGLPPLDKIAFYGAGWQIHAENLATHLAGRERGDTEARWAELVSAYQDLAQLS